MLLIRNTKHEGMTVKHLHEGGPVLGIVEWGNYRQGSIRVEEGDLLILFSDGVLEAMNPAHEPFGEHRLLHAIRECVTDKPREIQGAVHGALCAHVGGDGHEKNDDRTLIIARFRNVPAETASNAIDKVVHKN